MGCSPAANQIRCGPHANPGQQRQPWMDGSHIPASFFFFFAASSGIYDSPHPHRLRRIRPCMGTFSSLTPLFEKPISDSSRSIFGSIIRPSEQPHFTEIFGELHFKESPTAGRAPANSSLQLCTEGLGFESSDDPAGGPPDLGAAAGDVTGGAAWRRASRSNAVGFPPPISMIGSSGKPSMAFEVFKGEGRFVLREVRRAPAQELVLQARRVDGRLTLRLVPSEDDAPAAASAAADDDDEEEEEDVVDDGTEEGMDG